MKTVTNDNWSVGAYGSMIKGKMVYEFQPFKVHGRFTWDHMLKPGCYGMKFDSTDAYSAYALERGFTQQYYSRPWAFIGLRLSPATRRFLKGKTVKQIFHYLARILDKTGEGSYFRAVKTASYMREERRRWINYVQTGGQDTKSDPRNK